MQGAGGFQQHLSAQDVRVDKRGRLEDRAVDVALCCEIHDRIDAGGGVRYPIAVGDVTFDKPEARARNEIGHVAEIAAVSEQIVDYDVPLASRLEHVSNEVRPDEPAASRDEQPHACSATRLETRSRLSGVPASAHHPVTMS